MAKDVGDEEFVGEDADATATTSERPDEARSGRNALNYDDDYEGEDGGRAGAKWKKTSERLLRARRRGIVEPRRRAKTGCPRTFTLHERVNTEILDKVWWWTTGHRRQRSMRSSPR